jgi:hypothetical protein
MRVTESSDVRLTVEASVPRFLDVGRGAARAWYLLLILDGRADGLMRLMEQRHGETP